MFAGVSGLQMHQKAKVVSSGQPFLPPSGIGANRGTINVIRPVRYFNKAQETNLHSVGINAGRYFITYGNVLFSDFTAQKKLSSTSYMNSVETLNNMVKTFNESLLVINFNVIDENTFLLLRTIIESYLRQLEKFDGTINSETSAYAWVLEIESLNNATTMDARTIYANLIFTLQVLAETINLQLTYTSNQVYTQIVNK